MKQDNLEYVLEEFRLSMEGLLLIKIMCPGKKLYIWTYFLCNYI